MRALDRLRQSARCAENGWAQGVRADDILTLIAMLEAVWMPVETMPKGVWCQTMREGEDGTNESMWVETGVEEEPREYWDRAGYSTMINPGSFAPPTHWKPLPAA